jgi:hypothetical protein
MKIIKFTPPEIVQRNFVATSRREGGCSLNGEGNRCYCSEGFWISIGSGDTGLRVQFDSQEEMMAVFNGGVSYGETTYASKVLHDLQYAEAEAEAEKYGVAMEIGTDIMEGSYD